MNYFVGIVPPSAVGTPFRVHRLDWRLPPDPDPPASAGDLVYLLGWQPVTRDFCLIARGVIKGVVGDDRTGIAVLKSFDEVNEPLPDDLLPEAERVPSADSGDQLVGVDPYLGARLELFASPYLNTRPAAGRPPRTKVLKSDVDQLHEFVRRAKSRLGQDDFREDLLRAYDRRCAITECGIDACLEAAHIIEYSRTGEQLVTNGLLLRADIHLLFDRQLLRIFPGPPPVVALDTSLLRYPELKIYHGKPVRPPKDPEARPDPERLRRRWDAANEAGEWFDEPVKPKADD